MKPLPTSSKLYSATKWYESRNARPWLELPAIDADSCALVPWGGLGGVNVAGNTAPRIPGSVVVAVLGLRLAVRQSCA